MGGRVGYVGVGGFLTGGGLCFLTNMYGLASNTVVDYQIVLADGRVLWASEDPELAQAMRGAGYSFGGELSYHTSIYVSTLIKFV